MHFKLKQGFFKKVGRGKGSIVCRHKGGGVKKLYFLPDYLRLLYNIPGLVYKILYNPITNTKFGLILYTLGYYSFVPLSGSTKVGDVILNYKDSFTDSLVLKLDSCSKDSSYYPLTALSENSRVSYLEDYPFQGAVYSKSFGSTAVLIRHISSNFCLVRLASSELKIFYSGCRCIPDRLGKSIFFRVKKGTAGTSRRLGIRPTVRGVAMNPVDHPHGGGEGKSSGGRPSTSPWGWLTKGPVTRSRKRFSKFRTVLVKK